MMDRNMKYSKMNKIWKWITAPRTRLACIRIYIALVCFCDHLILKECTFSEQVCDAITFQIKCCMKNKLSTSVENNGLRFKLKQTIAAFGGGGEIFLVWLFASTISKISKTWVRRLFIMLYTSVFQPFLHHGPLYAIKKFWGTPNKIL